MAWTLDMPFALIRVVAEAISPTNLKLHHFPDTGTALRGYHHASSSRAQIVILHASGEAHFQKNSPLFCTTLEQLRTMSLPSAFTPKFIFQVPSQVSYLGPAPRLLTCRNLVIANGKSYPGFASASATG